MKAIMVMFDSLNRHMLPPYGCDWVTRPNFARLARADGHLRQLPTSAACRACPRGASCTPGATTSCTAAGGRWSRSTTRCPRSSRGSGVYTHLVSDHYHYWEDGGATYHTPLQDLGDRPRPGGRPVEGRGQGPGDARAVGRSLNLPGRPRPAGLGQPQVHPRRRGPAPGPDLRQGPGVHPDQQGRRQLVPPHRDASTRTSRSSRHGTVQGPLPARATPARTSTGRPTPRCSETARGDRAPAVPLRRAAYAMCDEYLGQGPRRDGRAGPVEGHDADREHRPRVPAGRARLVGQVRDALLQRGRPHAAVHLGPAPASRASAPVRWSRRSTSRRRCWSTSGASAAGHAGRAPGPRRSRPTRPCASSASSGIFGGHVNVTDGRYVYMRGPPAPRTSRCTSTR